MGTIEELLERVRKATGPDRRLDIAIHVLVTNEGRLGDYSSVDEYTNTAIQLGWNTPRVTASIGEALALVEHALPGWCYKLVQESGTYTFVVRDAPELAKVAASAVASKPTAPLAILTATLTALYVRSKP